MTKAKNDIESDKQLIISQYPIIAEYFMNSEDDDDDSNDSEEEKKEDP